jgi:hypothetical protein
MVAMKHAHETKMKQKRVLVVTLIAAVVAVMAAPNQDMGFQSIDCT